MTEMSNREPPKNPLTGPERDAIIRGQRNRREGRSRDDNPIDGKYFPAAREAWDRGWCGQNADILSARKYEK